MSSGLMRKLKYRRVVDSWSVFPPEVRELHRLRMIPFPTWYGGPLFPLVVTEQPRLWLRAYRKLFRTRTGADDE